MAVYEAYKDSGFEWLGSIPASWPMVLLSQAVTQVKNKNTDLQEQNLLSLSYGRIKRKPIDASGGLLPESFDGYNIIEANDIVLRLTDLQNDHRSLRVGLATERGIITSAYNTLRPRNQRGAKYLYYLLHTFDIRKGFYGMGSGVRQGLNYDEVKKLKLPLPSTAEQMAIADYLDRETERIDAIIAEATASIEEYKVWKLATIHEAVTKGINPNTEMAESGVESFGSVPSHWKPFRFQNVCKLRNECNSGGRELLSVYLDRGVIRYSDSTGMQVHKPSDSLEKYQNVYVGDFVLNNQQAWRGSVGVSNYDGIISPAYLVYDLTDVCVADYMAYLVRDICMVQQYELSSRGVGTIQRNIYEPWLRKTFVILPPQDEQIAIAEYLNKYCPQIEALIIEKQELIADLESYKKSLIFEVVTGKRKVV